MTDEIVDRPRASGARDDIIAELRNQAEGWAHFGKPALARAATEGVARLAAGDYSVRVGHTDYVVTDTTQ